jgi:alkylated DNA repair dioxygenase AlkB
MPEKGSQAKPQILQAPPIPPAFDWLLSLFVKQGIYSSDDLPQYCIVNEYRNDQGISAHVENFSFGEPVCSLSLGDSCPMRFQQLVKDNDGSVRSGKSKLAEKTGRKEVIQLPGKSLLVLRGEARRRWQHEIPRSRKNRKGTSGEDREWRRVSLTFRVMKR